MDYEKCYKELVGKMKKAYLYAQTDSTKAVLEEIFPELAESEDNRISREITEFLVDFNNGEYKKPNENTIDSWLSWLEKQKVTDEEIIFRPIVGTDIRIAAKQALERIDIGKKVVLVFNGAYIPVNGKTVGEIDNEYDAWLEKQGEQKPFETAKWNPQEESCICQLESLVKEQWRHAEKTHNSVTIKKMQELMFFLKTLNPNKMPQRMISAEAKEALYDNLAWSEEDDCMLNYAIVAVSASDYANDEKQEIENWLKSLKGRLKGE